MRRPAPGTLSNIRQIDPQHAFAVLLWRELFDFESPLGLHLRPVWTELIQEEVKLIEEEKKKRNVGNVEKHLKMYKRGDHAVYYLGYNQEYQKIAKKVYDLALFGSSFEIYPDSLYHLHREMIEFSGNSPNVMETLKRIESHITRKKKKNEFICTFEVFWFSSSPNDIYEDSQRFFRKRARVLPCNSIHAKIIEEMIRKRPTDQNIVSRQCLSLATYASDQIGAALEALKLGDYLANSLSRKHINGGSNFRVDHSIVVAQPMSNGDKNLYVCQSRSDIEDYDYELPKIIDGSIFLQPFEKCLYFPSAQKLSPANRQFLADSSIDSPESKIWEFLNRAERRLKEGDAISALFELSPIAEHALGFQTREKPGHAEFIHFSSMLLAIDYFNEMFSEVVRYIGRMYRKQKKKIGWKSEYDSMEGMYFAFFESERWRVLQNSNYLSWDVLLSERRQQILQLRPLFPRVLRSRRKAYICDLYRAIRYRNRGQHELSDSGDYYLAVALKTAVELVLKTRGLSRSRSQNHEEFLRLINGFYQQKARHGISKEEYRSLLIHGWSAWYGREGAGWR